jgi:hypothetical protein
LLIPDRLGHAQPVERLISELNRKNVGARCNAWAWNDQYQNASGLQPSEAVVEERPFRSLAAALVSRPVVRRIQVRE